MKIRKATYPFLKLACLTKSVDPLNNFLIFSEPRGGSTWLTEIVQTIPRTAVIWEPLNSKVYPALARMNFGVRQYVPESERWPELEHFVTEILRGRKLSYHSTSHTTAAELLRAERLIVKFCRGNALLPWFTRTFALRRRPVYLVRHPFAVVASQLQHGAWNRESARFQIPDSPFSSIYEPHADFLARLDSIEETLVARWCVANKPTLGNERNDRDWITVFYETLMIDPLSQLTRVFAQWNAPLPAGLAHSVRQPSRTVRPGNSLEQGGAQLAKWQRAFDTDTQKRMQRVLDHFEIAMYSIASVRPAPTP